MDLGTCRRTDLFITNDRNIPIENFICMDFQFNDEQTNAYNLIKRFNGIIEEKE